MIFIGWVEYPSMMICVHKDANGSPFYCTKYNTGGNKVGDGTKAFSSKEELREFLLSLSSPPIEFINDFLIKKC